MKNILCYGDSNTYGYNPVTRLRYDKKTRWTGILGDLLGEEYYVIEEGCNGRTTTYDDPSATWKNGQSYLRPCLNSHKPIDIVVLMLGTNNLKKSFGLTTTDIADSAGELVKVINSFTKEKQGYSPKIILIAPPEVGNNIANSTFSYEFDQESIIKSKEFAKEYKRVAKENECIYLNAAEYVKASEADSLHLMPDAHKALAKALYSRILSLG